MQELPGTPSSDVGLTRRDAPFIGQNERRVLCFPIRRGDERIKVLQLVIEGEIENTASAGGPPKPSHGLKFRYPRRMVL